MTNFLHAKYDSSGNQIDDPTVVIGQPEFAVDSSGAVTGLVGPGGADAGSVFVSGVSVTGMQKYYGLRTVSNNSALAQTRLLKTTAESDFDAVRIHHYHPGTTTPQWKFAVAVTETADTSTQSNYAYPTVGGAAYSVIDSTADQYGWRTCTFAGAATKTLAGTGNPTPPNFAPEIITSDWIPLSSVPRADGGALPLIMVMGLPVTAVTQNASWISAAGSAAMATATAANRGRIVQMSRNGSDAIAVPGAGTFIAQTDGMPIAIEFRYRTASTTICFIGDSLTQNQAIVADNFTSWGWRACADISTTSRPVVHCNMGAASSGSLEYWREGLRQMLLVKPRVAVYSAWTPNDPPYTTDALTRYAIQNMAARTVEFLDVCRQNNIRPVLDTGVPYLAGLGATQDALRKAYVARIRTMAASANAGLIDSDSLFSDGASPANIKSPYNFGDNIHYNEVGIELKAKYAGPILKRYL